MVAAVVKRIRRRPSARRQASNAAQDDMPAERHLIEIIHPGAAEGAVRTRKAGRLDDVGLDPEAGREPQNRAGVLRDVGLVEGDPHGRRFGPAIEPRQCSKSPIGKGFVRLLVICAAGGLALPL